MIDRNRSSRDIMAAFVAELAALREKAAATGIPNRAIAHLDMALMAAESELRRIRVETAAESD